MFCTAFGGTSKNLERNGKFLKYFVLVSRTEGVEKPWDPKPKINQNNTLGFHEDRVRNHTVKLDINFKKSKITQEGIRIIFWADSVFTLRPAPAIQSLF